MHRAQCWMQVELAGSGNSDSNKHGSTSLLSESELDERVSDDSGSHDLQGQAEAGVCWIALDMLQQHSCTHMSFAIFCVMRSPVATNVPTFRLTALLALAASVAFSVVMRVRHSHHDMLAPAVREEDTHLFA